MSVPAVLVIGATGQIGSALVRQLLPDHREGRLRLIAASRKPDAGLAIETCAIDIDAAVTEGLAPLRAAMRGVDRVFLLTSYTIAMLAQSKAVIDAAKAEGVSHIVHLGAAGKPDATKAYIAWHQLVEAYIARSGIGWTHLQPTMFMQNLMMMLALGGAPPGILVNYIGDAKHAWIDLEDIAAVAATVLREPTPHTSKIYPLATDAATMREVAALMTEVTGRPWRYEARAPEVFERTVVSGGAEPVYMGSVRMDFELLGKGLRPEAADVTNDFERVTQRKPRSLRSFLEAHRSAFTY
jgi:uncharacterized protein YbjT (DUF2867 family)